MLYANVNGGRIEASPDHRRGVCPTCDQQVIAKCGRIMPWHWAHRSADCDPWSEPETAWHKNWKELFPASWREVRMDKHRCDIRTPTHVIELQHSSISTTEIEERERFYGRMVWIFDLRAIASNLAVPTEDHGVFRWPRFRRSLAACKCPVFAHLRRGELLNIFGYGSPQYFCRYRRFSKEEFLTAVGAASSASLVSPTDFSVYQGPRCSLEQQRWWREHDLQTQPWLRRE